MQGFKEWLAKQGKSTNHPHLIRALKQIRQDLDTKHFDTMMYLPEFQDGVQSIL